MEVTGEQLLHDNGDVQQRCEDVLQFSQIHNGEKTYIMDTLRSWQRQVLLPVQYKGGTVSGSVKWDEETNRTYLCLPGALPAEFPLELIGGKVVADGHEASKTMVQFGGKGDTLGLARNKFGIHQMMFRISGRATETEGVIDAITELLTLTEDEYLGPLE